jgi:hypothetical protein
MSIRQLQKAKEFLDLSKQIVVNFISFVLDNLFGCGINCSEKLVPELWHHEELLQHRIHVAYASKICNAYMLMNSAVA